MTSHPALRHAVISALENSLGDNVTLFDGRPANIDTTELPAIAVYLTEAKPSDQYLDGNYWTATLHVEVFLKAKATDTELDTWMEDKVIPVMDNIPSLNALFEESDIIGYDYQRDDEMAFWGSADYQMQLTYQREVKNGRYSITD